MLPAFAVRQLWQSDDIQRDGIVRMASEEYDALLARKPSAALSYLDEEDGETVEVGSAFELSQRLQDPPSTKAAAINATFLPSDTFLAGKVPDMHRFDIRRSQSILDMWRDQDKITKDGLWNQQNQSVTCSSPTRESSPSTSSTLHLATPAELVPEVQDDDNEDANSSLTPKGRQLAEAAASKFHSPLRDVPTVQHRKAGSIEAVHENRWASYGRLGNGSAPFPQQPSVLSQQPNVRDVDDQGLEIPSPTPEHRPLLDLYEAELARLKSFRRKAVAAATAATASPRESNGLLSVREFLDPLKSTQSDANSLPELAVESGISNDSPAPLPDAKTVPESASEPSRNISTLNPGETLALSLRSLGEGLKDFAGSLKQFFPEVQQHLTTAQHKLPHHIDRALRTSVSNLTNALDQFDPTASRRHAVASAPVAPPVDMTRIPVQHAANDVQNAFTRPVPIFEIHEMYHGQPDVKGDVQPADSPLPRRDTHTTKPSQDKPLPPLVSDEQKGSTNKENQPPRAPSPLKMKLPSAAKSSLAPPPEYRAQELVGRRFIHYCLPDGPVYTQYLVRWCGCSSDEDTWYDVKNLKDCADLVEAYDLQNPMKRRHEHMRPSMKRAYESHAANLHVRTAVNPMMVFRNEENSPPLCEMEPHKHSGSVYDEMCQCAFNYLGRDAERKVAKHAEYTENAIDRISHAPKLPHRTSRKIPAGFETAYEVEQRELLAKQMHERRESVKSSKAPATETSVPRRCVSFVAPKTENQDAHRATRHGSPLRKEFATGPDRFAKSPPPPLPPKEVKHRKSWHPDSHTSSLWASVPSPPNAHNLVPPVVNMAVDAVPTVVFPALPPLEPLAPQREADVHHNPWSSETKQESLPPLPPRENAQSLSSLNRAFSYRGHLPSEIRPRSKMLRRAESARFARPSPHIPEEERPLIDRQDKRSCTTDRGSSAFDSPPLSASDPPKLDLNDSNQVEYIAADTICPLPKPHRSSNLRHCQSAAELNRRNDKHIRVKDWVSQASNNLHSSTDANELYAPPSPMAYAATPATPTAPLLPLTTLDAQPLPVQTSSYGPYISPFDSPPSTPFQRRSRTFPSNAPYKTGKELDCLTKLTELGYGTREFTGGWDDKLAFVTREVQGELNAAIDRLEEDRLAWEMRQ